MGIDPKIDPGIDPKIDAVVVVLLHGHERILWDCGCRGVKNWQKSVQCQESAQNKCVSAVEVIFLRIYSQFELASAAYLTIVGVRFLYFYFFCVPHRLVAG